MKNRVILYCRVSTTEQSEHGISLSAQQAKLERYCALYDLEPVAVIVDGGHSAKSLRRPGIQRALAMLDSGEADGICVTKLDRLTRNIGNWQHLIDRYFSEKRGLALHSIEDRLDSSSAMGRLIINVTLSVSQWERETCGERTKAALQHKVLQGEKVGECRSDMPAMAKDLCRSPQSKRRFV